GHQDKAIRKWALDVVIDLQGRGVSVARNDLIDVLARLLADGDDEARLKAVIALVNLKGAAAPARAALGKAAREDQGPMVAHYAQEALKAIDAATPRPEPKKEPPAGKKIDIPGPDELAKMATIIKPTPEENKWQQIPWITDVNEGRRLAKAEKRPLLLVVIFGELLDEC